MTERTGTIVVSFGWLLGCVAVGILGFWYPAHVDSQFGPEVDSRMGFLYLFTFPLLVGAGVVAVFSLIRLLRAARGDGARAFGVIYLAGVILAFLSLAPLAVIGFRLIYGVIQ